MIAAFFMRRRNPNAGIVVFWVKLRQRGYEDRTETVKKIDPFEQKIVLEKKYEDTGINQTIDISKVVAIHGDLVDYIDEAMI